MTRQRFLILALAALLVLGVALWLNLSRNASTPEFQESPLVPALATELDTVSALSVRKGSPTPSVTLHKTNNQWTIAERGDYPADVSKLHKLLIALGDAKIVEEKTANPAEFSLIGVEDPTKSGASGTEIALTARDGTHVVIIGKPSGQGDFARRAGQNQSFLIQPAISLETEPRFWIDAHLIDIPLTDLKSIEVKPASGPPYVLERTQPKDEAKAKDDKKPQEVTAPQEPQYTLEGVPTGRKAADARTLAPSPSLGGELTADDVAFAKDIDFSKPSSATITLSGDKVIAFIGSVVGDKHWIEITSAASSTLAARLQGRAFEIPSYRYDAIFRPLEQLLVPKPTPAPKPSLTPKHSSTAKPPAPP